MYSEVTMSGGGKKGADVGGRSTVSKQPTAHDGTDTDKSEAFVDSCDFAFDVQLTSVNTIALRKAALGQRLGVAIQEQRPYETIVCKLVASDEVVGAIAAVEKLGLLIRCIRDGHMYEAIIVGIDGTICRVRVMRTRR